MLNLKSPIGTNYRVDPNDLMDTKRALSDLGYYDVPPHRGIDDWTDDATFDGIKRFQQDNGLKVDGFMWPGGPTEQKVNSKLAATDSNDGSGANGQSGVGDDLPLQTGPFTIPPQSPRPPVRMPPPYDNLPKPSSAPQPQKPPFNGPWVWPGIGFRG